MILSIDLGSSSLKVALFDEKGRRLRIRRVIHPSVNRWASLDIIREVSQDCKISAIAISAQGPTLVPVTAAGTVLKPLFYYENNGLRHPEASSLFLPKAAFLKEQEPELYAAAESFLTAGDYIAYLLTGCKFVSEPFHLAGYRKFLWDDEQIKCYNLDLSKFPSYFNAALDTRLTNGAFGLPRGIPVVTVVFDFLAALAGSGAVSSTIISNRGGQSEGINFMCDTDSPAALPFAGGLEWRVFPHIIAGKVNNGLVSNDLHLIFGALQRELGFGNCDTFFSSLAEHAEKFAIPYGLTERFPFWPWSPGRASADVLEALKPFSAYEQALIVFKLYTENLALIVRNWPGPVTEARVSGGQAASKILNAYKACKTGIKWVTLKEPFSELLGNVILTQVERGFFPDIPAACRALVKREKEFMP
jgi:sugar (pentulose or hexulose) kinase